MIMPITVYWSETVQHRMCALFFNMQLGEPVAENQASLVQICLYARPNLHKKNSQ